MNKRTIIRVEDVMESHFDIVDGVATVAEALRGAKYLDNECLIVDRRHEDDEFGILLLADIAKQVLSVDKSAERVNVYEVMSKPVISVSPDMDIRYCTRLFNKFGLTRAPVIKVGKVLGLVSYKDIVLKGLFKSL